MLVVKLEIHPDGDAARAREIGRLELARVPREGLLEDPLREEYQRRREAGELPRAIAQDMGGRDLGSYQGHITLEPGLDADVDVPVFDRSRGGWALVLAALQALWPQLEGGREREG